MNNMIIGENSQENWKKDLLIIIRKGIDCLPFLSFLFIAIGLLYILFYTLRNNIPFPLSLSALPALLIIIAIIASGLMIISISVLFLPLIVTMGNDKNVTNYLSLNHDRSQLKKIFLYMRIFGNSILMIYFIFYLSVLFGNKLSMWYAIWPSYLYSLARTLCYCNNKFNPKNKFDFLSSLSLANFLTFIWTLFVIVLFGSVAKLYIDLNNKYLFHICYWLTAMFSLIFNYLQTMPNRTVVQNLKNPKVALILFLLLLLTPVFIPGLGGSLSEASLKVLKLGGGYKSTLFLSRASEKQLPSYIFASNNNNKNLVKTKKITVLLNIGEEIFFKLPEQETTFAINKKNVIFTEIEK